MTGVYNLELFSSLQAGVHFRKIFSFAQSHLLKNCVVLYPVILLNATREYFRPILLVILANFAYKIN